MYKIQAGPIPMGDGTEIRMEGELPFAPVAGHRISVTGNNGAWGSFRVFDADWCAELGTGHFDLTVHETAVGSSPSDFAQAFQEIGWNVVDHFSGRRYNRHE